MKQTILAVVIMLLTQGASLHAGGQKPAKVFVLAGQSNMEGQAVVDLEGDNYNGGKGTLAMLMRDPAKAAAAARPEFAGNVLFVPTHDFVREAEESPNVGHGHHEFGNAETYFLVGDALGKGLISLVSPSPGR